MPCVMLTTLPTQHQRRVMTDHPWNGSRVSTSPLNYVISMLLAALRTYWTTPCKVAREHRSRSNALDWAYTSDLRPIMLDLSLWFLIHAQATYHHNSMSNSTIFLRRYKTSPPTWTHPNRNGNTSVVLRSRRAILSQQAEESSTT